MLFGCRHSVFDGALVRTAKCTAAGASFRDGARNNLRLCPELSEAAAEPVSGRRNWCGAEFQRTCFCFHPQFDPDGRVLMTLGRKPEALRVPAGEPAGPGA